MPKNVLWIMSDQHTYRAAGCYGNPVVQTPNIDALAREGMRFDCAYTPAPVCMPARDAMLCSRYPHRLGGNPVSTKIPTAAHRFREAGYCTAHIGKMHPHLPYTRGFDYLVDAGHYYEFLGPKMETFTRGMDARNTGCCYPWMSSQWYPHHSWRDDPLTPGMPTVLDEPDHFESFVATCCDSFLDSCDSATPFFLQASFLKPHFPYASPPQYHALYDPDAIDLPATLHADAGIPEQSLQINGRLAPGAAGEAEARRTLAEYYAATTFMDACLGRIVTSLQQRGLWDKTIVIYTSDHGDMLYDYGLTGKFIFREPSVRVPLIVRAPGVTGADTVSTALTDLTDLLPTCLSLCDIPFDERVDGVDLSPVLRGTATQAREVCFSAFRENLMIRDRHWKLSRYSGDTWQLFDMQNDADERVNRYAELREKKDIRALSERLLAWRAERAPADGVSMSSNPLRH